MRAPQLHGTFHSPGRYSTAKAACAVPLCLHAAGGAREALGITCGYQYQLGPLLYPIWFTGVTFCQHYRHMGSSSSHAMVLCVPLTQYSPSTPHLSIGHAGCSHSHHRDSHNPKAPCWPRSGHTPAPWPPTTVGSHCKPWLSQVSCRDCDSPAPPAAGVIFHWGETHLRGCQCQVRSCSLPTTTGSAGCDPLGTSPSAAVMPRAPTLTTPPLRMGHDAQVDT